MGNKTVTRQELYELVWSKPVTHIAKQYGFSDNGIRKICKKHTIPLPNSGYWSKLKYNKPVVKAKLPKQDDNPKIILENTNPALFEGSHKRSELAIAKKELANTKGLIFKVPNKLSKPHSLTVATRNFKNDLIYGYEKGYWHIKTNETEVLSISVSKELFKRSLLFMDSFIKILETRGHVVTANDNTKVSIKGHSYTIRLKEKNKRVKKESNTSWPQFDLVPTGNLCLKLDRSYPIKEWSDSKTKTLEDKLPDIIAWLEIRAKKDEEEKIAREIWHKELEIEAKREKELQERRQNELTKFTNLFESATRWHKTQYLRNYIKEFEAFVLKTNTLDADKKEWINWAKEKADWYDPFIEKDDALLSGIDRDSLKFVTLK
jgi:hypothetical protein|tara:strand:- start:151807 stop:152934 length:1128 start_codon:yes stop_codon:yes gene_type:complete